MAPERRRRRTRRAADRYLRNPRRRGSHDPRRRARRSRRRPARPLHPGNGRRAESLPSAARPAAQLVRGASAQGTRPRRSARSAWSRRHSDIHRRDRRAARIEHRHCDRAQPDFYLLVDQRVADTAHRLELLEDQLDRRDGPVRPRHERSLTPAAASLPLTAVPRAARGPSMCRRPAIASRASERSTSPCAARRVPHRRSRASSRIETDELSSISSDSWSRCGCTTCGSGIVARQAVPSRNTLGVSVKNLPS